MPIYKEYRYYKFCAFWYRSNYFNVLLFCFHDKEPSCLFDLHLTRKLHFYCYCKIGCHSDESTTSFTFQYYKLCENRCNTLIHLCQSYMCFEITVSAI